MNNLKHMAAIVKALKALGYAATVQNAAGHLIVTVDIDGKPVKFTASGTPRNSDYAVSNVVQDVKRYLRGHYTRPSRADRV
jgi:hypothetical protein